MTTQVSKPVYSATANLYGSLDLEITLPDFQKALRDPFLASPIVCPTIFKATGCTSHFLPLHFWISKRQGRFGQTVNTIGAKGPRRQYSLARGWIPHVHLLLAKHKKGIALAVPLLCDC